jgi:hypothetical protein
MASADDMDMDRDRQLKARILQATQGQAAPSRQDVRRRVAITLATAVVVPLAAFLLVGAARPGPRPLALVLATSGGALGIALAAIWTAYGRGGQMVGRARARLLAMTVAAPATFVIWKLAWSSQYDHMTEDWATRPGLRCFALTMLFAAWPFLALASVRRGSDPTHPRALGAALGVATGTCAAVLVDLWCPVAHPRHLAIGHLLPIVILGLLGVWVGHRVLAVRGKK